MEDCTLQFMKFCHVDFAYHCGISTVSRNKTKIYVSSKAQNEIPFGRASAR